MAQRISGTASKKATVEKLVMETRLDTFESFQKSQGKMTLGAFFEISCHFRDVERQLLDMDS